MPLSPKTLAFLRKRSEKVAAEVDDRAARSEARRLWDFQDNKAFYEIREVLRKMAPGNEHCMYCQCSHGDTIDHFWPKANYPYRTFDWLNYLLSCSECNRKKGNQFYTDATGQPLLVNPTEEDPLDHLSFSPSTGLYQPLSPKGDPSIQVFGLNRIDLTQGRVDAWTVLNGLLVVYAGCRRTGDEEWADSIEMAVKRHPFSGVLAALVRIAEGPAADVLISAECLQALRSHPEVFGWI